MGGIRKRSFQEEIKDLDHNGEEYKAIVRRYLAIAEAEEKLNKIELEYIHRILELCYPVKLLNVSKLRYTKRDKLISIGKAARALHEELRKAGLLPKGFVSDKWSQ